MSLNTESDDSSMTNECGNGGGASHSGSGGEWQSSCGTGAYRHSRLVDRGALRLRLLVVLGVDGGVLRGERGSGGSRLLLLHGLQFGL